MNCNYNDYFADEPDGRCPRCARFSDKFFLEGISCNCAQACSLCKEIGKLVDAMLSKEKKAKAKFLFIKKHGLNPDIKCYSLTLTTKSSEPGGLQETLNKLNKSKIYEVENFGWELTKKGIPHLHILLKSEKYIKERDLVRVNRGDFVKLIKLKTKTDINKWRNYCHKKKSLKEQKYYKKMDIIISSKISKLISNSKKI